MDSGRNWIIVSIDGKVAAISKDYGRLADISARIAEEERLPVKTGRKRQTTQKKERKFNEICARAVSFEEVWELRNSLKWEDLMLFGTEFQKRVWRKLWELTHPLDSEPAGTSTEGSVAPEGKQSIRLISYSDFAELCQNRAGVRAVAHAIGMNPISVVIPCHLVIPKESIDKINEIHKKAEDTIFKGDDLCLSSILKDNSIDFGEYALGKGLKRKLINLEQPSTSL